LRSYVKQIHARYKKHKSPPLWLIYQALPLVAANNRHKCLPPFNAMFFKNEISANANAQHVEQNDE
jgi:hypothetical protein